MLLADLYELHGQLARAGKINAAGFKRGKVHFLVNVDQSGQILDLVDLRDARGQGATRIIPVSNRTSGNYAHLICDGLDYVAALPKAPDKKPQSEQRHQMYIERLLECAGAVGEPARSMLNAVVNATQDASSFLASLRRLGAPLDLSIIDGEPHDDRLDIYEDQAKWSVDFQVDGHPLLPEIKGSPGEQRDHRLVDGPTL